MATKTSWRRASGQGQCPGQISTRLTVTYIYAGSVIQFSLFMADSTSLVSFVELDNTLCNVIYRYSNIDTDSAMGNSFPFSRFGRWQITVS